MIQSLKRQMARVRLARRRRSKNLVWLETSLARN
jgi:hypothetical protein